MRRVTLLWAAGALVLLIGLTPAARGAGLALTSSNPAGSPLTFQAGATSPSMLIKVVADASPASPGPADRMTAWQFRLQVVPDAGATGAVTFNNPSGSTPADPPNYVFADGVGIFAARSAGNTVLDANDFDIAAASTPSPTLPVRTSRSTSPRPPTPKRTFALFAVADAAATPGPTPPSTAAADCPVRRRFRADRHDRGAGARGRYRLDLRRCSSRSAAAAAAGAPPCHRPAPRRRG